MKTALGIVLIVFGVMLMFCGLWFVGIPLIGTGIYILCKKEKKETKERRD